MYRGKPWLLSNPCLHRRDPLLLCTEPSQLSVSAVLHWPRFDHSYRRLRRVEICHQARVRENDLHPKDWKRIRNMGQKKHRGFSLLSTHLETAFHYKTPCEFSESCRLASLRVKTLEFRFHVLVRQGHTGVYKTSDLIDLSGQNLYLTKWNWPLDWVCSFLLHLQTPARPGRPCVRTQYLLGSFHPVFEKWHRLQTPVLLEHTVQSSKGFSRH